MKNILQDLVQHKTLSQDAAKQILKEIAVGKYNNSQVAAFLAVFMMRNITPDELSGFRDALLDLCVPVDFSDFNTIDLCGTGGDGKNTFNISTLSSLVVAGAGYKVSKHGNYGVSSACGSSNIMEYFGYEFTNDQEKLKKQLDDNGYVYLHAPFFHPAMKAVGPIRRDLSMKTFFNMLGPMVNPSRPQNQIVGVFDLETLRLYNYIYQQSENNFSLIYGLDGYDEISLTGDFKMITNNEDIKLNPEKLGLPRFKEEDLFGGNTVKEAAKIFQDILDGNGTEAQNSVIFANAGMAIRTYNHSRSIEECIEEAKKSLLDKRALDVFKKITQ